MPFRQKGEITGVPCTGTDESHSYRPLQDGRETEARPFCLTESLLLPHEELTSQDQDEDLEAKTKRDDSTLERALPRGPVKMKTKIPVRVG
ncbi:unnamed protein product [Ascophyllum nodosum]